MAIRRFTPELRNIVDQKNKLQSDLQVRQFKYRANNYLEQVLRERMVRGLTGILGIGTEEWDLWKEKGDSRPAEEQKKLLDDIWTELSSGVNGKLYTLMREDIKDLSRIRKALLKEPTAEECRKTEETAENSEEKIKAVLEAVETCLMKRQWTALREQCRMNGMNNPAIERFMNVRTYTALQNMEKIANAAGLDEEQKSTFLSLRFRTVFDDPTPLKELKNKLRDELKTRGWSYAELFRRTQIDPSTWNDIQMQKKRKDKPRDELETRGGSCGELLRRTQIDPSTWNDIQAEGETGDGKVTQKTLLKLTVGFQYDSDAGWALLRTVDSGFAFDLDLVVLACLCLGASSGKPYQIETVQRFIEELIGTKKAVRPGRRSTEPRDTEAAPCGSVRIESCHFLQK